MKVQPSCLWSYPVLTCIRLCLLQTMWRTDDVLQKTCCKWSSICLSRGLTEARNRVCALQICGTMWPAGGPSSYQDWSISSISSSPAPAKWPITPVIISGDLLLCPNILLHQICQCCWGAGPFCGFLLRS